jgi:hypothetical protein
MKSTATDDHHRHPLASRNPAGSHPPDPVPQTLGGSLAAGGCELETRPCQLSTFRANHRA